MLFYWALLVTGFTSAFNCVALQMGLMGSTIAKRQQETEKYSVQPKLKPTWVGTTAFLSSKLFAYMLVGFSLGAFGKGLAISKEASSVIELIAGLYVILAALNILQVHPILRYAVLQPPRFILKYVKAKSKSRNLFAPTVLGFLTILIPCGTTVAIESIALSSGNPIYGALIMGVFTLGTMPVFLGYGALSAFIGETLKRRFDQISAVIILILGVYSIWRTLGEI